MGYSEKGALQARLRELEATIGKFRRASSAARHVAPPQTTLSILQQARAAKAAAAAESSSAQPAQAADADSAPAEIRVQLLDLRAELQTSSRAPPRLASRRAPLPAKMGPEQRLATQRLPQSARSQTSPNQQQSATVPCIPPGAGAPAVGTSPGAFQIRSFKDIVADKRKKVLDRSLGPV